MIIDAAELPAGHLIRRRVCIVGGGVVGITLARELAALEQDVCVLEGGGRGPEAESQALFAGECVGHPYYPLDTARGRQLGGSSVRWMLDLGGERFGARLRPMSPIDFEKRDWVPDSGWPFDYETLVPFYRRAQRIFRVGPYDYAADGWGGRGHAPLPLDPAAVETVVYQCVDRQLFCRDYHDELESRPDVTVYLHANALELETDPGGQQVRRIEVAGPDGKRFSVEAEIVVLALNGIETPRLLLLSNRHQPAGLGNQHDRVGRFFMEHPHLWSGHIRPYDRGLFERSGLYAVHDVDDIPVIGQLTLPDRVLRRERLLNYAAVIKPGYIAAGARREAITHGAQAFRAALGALRHRDVDGFNRHMSTLFPVVNNLTSAAYRRGTRLMNRLMRLKPYEVFRLNHMAEQIPNPDSRVTLGDQVDRFGQRQVRLDWRLSSQDIDSMVRAQRVIDTALHGAGIGRLTIELEGDTPPPDLHGGWHHMGTTRMHDDPRQGVCDAHGRVHGVDNLYVAGPSLFPTSGCANPALTTVALTLRLADHLKQSILRCHDPLDELRETR